MVEKQYLLKIGVAPCWVEDGYNPNNLQRIEEFIMRGLEERLPHADGSELSIKVEKFERSLTCVYCGYEYPADTPATGSQVAALTEHVKNCPQHPLFKATKWIAALQSELTKHGWTHNDLERLEHQHNA